MDFSEYSNSWSKILKFSKFRLQSNRQPMSILHVSHQMVLPPEEAHANLALEPRHHINTFLLLVSVQMALVFVALVALFASEPVRRRIVLAQVQYVLSKGVTAILAAVLLFQCYFVFVDELQIAAQNIWKYTNWRFFNSFPHLTPAKKKTKSNSIRNQRLKKQNQRNFKEG